METRSQPDSASPENAQRLYHSCCSQDPEECNAAYDRLGNFLLRIAHRHLQSQPDGGQTAKDCTQQALMAIWQKLSKGQGPDHIAGFMSWSAAIVTHKVFDELRKRGRARTLSLDEQTEYDDTWLTQLPDANTPTPEQQTVARTAKADLMRLIETHEQLSPKAKFVLLCTYFAERSDGELAHDLKRKEVSVRVMRSRALTVLREDDAFMESLAALFAADDDLSSC